MARRRVARLLVSFALLALPASAFAQPSVRPGLTGAVTDASGAVMQSVIVRVFEPDGDTPVLETATDADGRYVAVLPPGTWRVEIAAPAFTPFAGLIVVPRSEPLDVQLDLEPIEEAVDVRPDETFSVNPGMSLTSTTISGDDLADLPRDEEELAAYLMQLAGADATGDIGADVRGNFIVDGFNDGRLPDPDRIAQVIIDPGSMSADGRGPRIEIVTRPGTGRWRRSFEVGFADESLNARTPGEGRKEPRQTRDAEFEIEGPVIPGVMEISLQGSTASDERAGDSLRAITPAGSLFQGVVRPESGREFEVAAEIQLTQSHRLDVMFGRETSRATNAGVGGFRLPERGSQEQEGEWTLRISERWFRQNFTNNFRVQVDRSSESVTPVVEGIAIDVADAFAGGGGTERSAENETRVRIEDNLRLQRGSWNFQMGGELSYRNRRSMDRSNYNGTFEFASLHDYCVATDFAGANCAETRRIVEGASGRGATPVYFDAAGNETPITGVPITFTQAFGNAELQFSELAFETFFQANRRLGDRAALNLGLRYEGTNHSQDFLRFDPTANLQYRLAEATLVSAGVRLSFDDFRDYERLLRNDGSTYETELYISSPTFPDPFQGGTVETGQNTASLWVLSEGYRSPYRFDPQVSLTQQMPGNVRVTLSYSESRGFRQRRTRNVNAPFPGTPLPDEILDLPLAQRQGIIDRMRPFYPMVGNITQIETTGRSVGRTVRLSVQPRGRLDLAGLGLSGSAFYTYRRADDDNDSNNPYFREWGPARRDHEVQTRFRLDFPDEADLSSALLRLLAAGTYQDTSLNFFFRASTGRLYSLRSGRDLNGDQSTNDRPVGVARNTETGPANWRLDMTLSKSIRLGAGRAAPARALPRAGGQRGGPVQQAQAGPGGQGGPGAPAPGGRSDRGGGDGGRTEGPRLRVQVRVNNLLNQTQARGYVSTLTSPLFGQPTGFTRGRTINLSMSFDF